MLLNAPATVVASVQTIRSNAAKVLHMQMDTGSALLQ